MKKIVLSFVLFVSFLSSAYATEGEYTPMDDIMAPDEIAEELGLPRTEADDISVLNVEDVANTEAVDLLRSFPIVIVINKKAWGPGAQRMRVYQNGYLTHEWAVSTGRERWERARSGRTYFSVTPVGYFYPRELVRDHWSHTWQTSMEYSVFFNGGIATHATTPSHYKELGSRASGGCVRLQKEHAQYLYTRIKEEGRGLVPLVKRNGMISRDRYGRAMRAVKWRTLIVVEDR
ncbi:L,D-transpeptidase [Bdellovibrio bacteriovorus]|uniref:L,D-transpeptidase n=1 Tax=Bdellovibrio bacteriovorus TaxID=959 RepID=UPI0035A616F8